VAHDFNDMLQAINGTLPRQDWPSPERLSSIKTTGQVQIVLIDSYQLENLIIPIIQLLQALPLSAIENGARQILSEYEEGDSVSEGSGLPHAWHSPWRLIFDSWRQTSRCSTH
jgi:hypothetical protein